VGRDQVIVSDLGILKTLLSFYLVGTAMACQEFDPPHQGSCFECFVVVPPEQLLVQITRLLDRITGFQQQVIISCGLPFKNGFGLVCVANNEQNLCLGLLQLGSYKQLDLASLVDNLIGLLDQTH